jgi:hypothetical protein
MPTAQKIWDVIDKAYNDNRGYTDYYFYDESSVEAQRAYDQQFALTIRR